MKHFPWLDSYDLGIPKIDLQHKQLVEILNKLHEAAVNKRAKQELGNLLLDAKRYAKEHFTTEERLFSSTYYPEADAHIKAHQQFSNKISEFEIAYQKGHAVLPIQVLVFLMDWLRDHICTVDAKFAHYLKETQRS